MMNVALDLRVQRALGFIVLITIAWVVALGVEVKGFDTSKRQILAAYEHPVAALELASTPERLRDVLDQGDRDHNVAVMNLNTGMDFLFIGLYCSTLWLLADAYITRSMWPLLAKIAIVITGMFDIMENLQLFREFRAVASLAPETVNITRAVSLTKWTALACALWFLAAHYWSIRHRTGGSSGLLTVFALSTAVAAAATTVGLFDNSLISLMSWPFGLTLLLVAFMFFPFRRRLAAAQASGA
jgi:hypothetical protein